MKKAALCLVLALSLAAPAWPQDDKGHLAERLDDLSQALDVTLGALNEAAGAALGEAAGQAERAADKALGATLEALDKASKALIKARDDLKKSRTREFAATVRSITDGDTLVVQTAEAEVIIRLFGLDAPESGQEGGEAAAKALSPIQGRQVTIREMDGDSESRLSAQLRRVALVEYEGASVNLAQVQKGLAWYCPQACQEQPICGELEKAEKEAREAKRGLWSKGWFWEKKGEPVPPWEWRSGNKPSSQP